MVSDNCTDYISNQTTLKSFGLFLFFFNSAHMYGGAKTKGRVNFYKLEKGIICVATKLHTKNFGLIYYKNYLSQQ